MFNYISVIDSVNGSCPWLKQPIPCDFNLYANATSLANNQKLLPNTDITGSKIIILFVVTSFVAALLTLFLLADEAILLFRPMSKENYLYYRRLVHVMDTLLHGLSDTQVAAGIAMLVVVSFHASCISAYHYNVACYLMLMSLTTHILAFVNVPKFCSKGVFIGVIRILAIVAILGLTWALFKARDAIQGFPVDPSSLAIMPAACFVGNQTSALGLDYLDSHNISQILGSTGTSASSAQYNMFLPVAVAGIIGIIFLVADSFEALQSFHNTHRGSLISTLCIRTIITCALLVICIIATTDYFHLKTNFELDKWYVADDEDTTSLSQLLTLTLSIPSIFAVLKAVVDSIEGPRDSAKADAVFHTVETRAKYVSANSSEIYETINVIQDKGYFGGGSYP